MNMDWMSNNASEKIHMDSLLKKIHADYYETRSKNNRAIPIQLINQRTFYDVRKYIELLIQTCNSVIEPFGIKLNLGPSSNNEAGSILPGYAIHLTHLRI
jgi:hypothetical protein